MIFSHTNYAKEAVITSTQANDLPLENLCSQGLGQVWKSGEKNNIIVITFDEIKSVGFVALLNHNLEKNSDYELIIKTYLFGVQNSSLTIDMGNESCANTYAVINDVMSCDSVTIEFLTTASIAEKDEPRAGLLWIGKRIEIEQTPIEDSGTDNYLFADSNRTDRSFFYGQSDLRDGSSFVVANWTVEAIDMTQLYGSEVTPEGLIDVIQCSGTMEPMIVAPRGSRVGTSYPLDNPEKAVFGIAQFVLNNVGQGMHNLSVSIREVNAPN